MLTEKTFEKICQLSELDLWLIKLNPTPQAHQEIRNSLNKKIDLGVRNVN